MAVHDTLDARFAGALGQLIGPDFPSEIALAVSGGGDSMAMLALAHNWARVWGVSLRVVTVDHGLRAESAAEAELVARECKALGHPHDTLRWHWDGTGNVMNAARRARLDLIGAWRGTTRHVLMAHTADDIAETFLLRLARGSGVEGLAAMRARRDVAQGFTVIRPCLDMRRAELRHYANALHIPLVDDPTNENLKYDRARARALLAPLADLGLGAEDLIATAHRMQRASAALWARAVSVADDVVTEHPSGTLIFERDGFAIVERDTQLRLLAAALMWVSGAHYRPRAASLEDLLERALAGGGGTLSGARVEAQAERLFVFRELAAIAEEGRATLWDGRWSIAVQIAPGQRIAPLGEAIRAFPNWRDSGLPRAALMALPAVFEGETCQSVPILSVNPTCHIIIERSFREFLLSH